MPMRRQKRISCYLPSVCRSGDRVNPLGEHRLQGSRIATIMLAAVAGTSCCWLICRRGKSNFCIRLRQINPTGKSLLIFRNRVKPLLQKYFASLPTQISSLIRPVPSHRGACARYGRGAGCGGRWQRARRARPAGVRPSRVVLTPQCRRQVCDRKRRRRCQTSMVTGESAK